jgi:hypothetical protein
VVSVAGWEERCRYGTQFLLAETRAKRLVMFFYKDLSDWTRANRRSISRLCDKLGVEVIPIELSFDDPLGAWRTLSVSIPAAVKNDRVITLDVTAMPRDTIWIMCHLVHHSGVKIQFAYHRPEQYAHTWLSRDPGKPRFVYKLAGICDFGKPTALAIITGFDVERTRQLVNFYEPEILFLGVQVGSQHENDTKNRDRHIKALRHINFKQLFDIDCYSIDDSTASLETALGPLVDKANLILTSTGPKLSALAIYQFKEAHPKIALAYAPSNEYNRKYSKDYLGTITGLLSNQTSAYESSQ